MPCSDAGRSDRHPFQDVIVRLACERCRELETKGEQVPKWAFEFWQQHKLEDAQRAKNELKIKQRAELVRNAFSKLTEEERRELRLWDK